MEIHYSGITKFYGGKRALNGVSFTVEKGSCTCLLGPNGAGKSTLLNITMGLAMPEEGTVTIGGMQYPEDADKIKQRMGCIPQNDLLIPQMTGEEFLFFHGLLLKMDKKKLVQQIGDLAAVFFEHENDIKKPVSAYSMGMRRRLEFCAALLNSPELLLLDEPFNALDPIFGQSLLRFLDALRQKGKTLVISSHDLAYVKEVATHIALVSEGELLFYGEAKDFFKNQQSVFESFSQYIEKSNQHQAPKDLPLWV